VRHNEKRQIVPESEAWNRLQKQHLKDDSNEENSANEAFRPNTECRLMRVLNTAQRRIFTRLKGDSRQDSAIQETLGINKLNRIRNAD
jgi:hypothetical protein